MSVMLKLNALFLLNYMRYHLKCRIIIIIIIIIIITLCRVFTIIYLKQTMFMGSTTCSYSVVIVYGTCRCNDIQVSHIIIIIIIIIIKFLHIITFLHIL